MTLAELQAIYDDQITKAVAALDNDTSTDPTNAGLHATARYAKAQAHAAVAQAAAGRLADVTA